MVMLEESAESLLAPNLAGCRLQGRRLARIAGLRIRKRNVVSALMWPGIRRQNTARLSTALSENCEDGKKVQTG
jgi:hypothetical protein